MRPPAGSPPSARSEPGVRTRPDESIPPWPPVDALRRDWLATVIVWLNGPFGVGKTTSARALAVADPAFSVFDPEAVGALLDGSLRPFLPVGDFQEWRSWRTVVVAALVAVHGELGRDLVVPQSVLQEAVWRELRDGLEQAGVPVRMLVLDVDPGEHERRIAGDAVEAGAAGWRRARRADYDRALGWLRREGAVLDTSGLDAGQVLLAIRATLA